MNHRATRLLDTAIRQIAELVGALSDSDEAALRQPCPGREKLGDGTVAAVALHIADTYHRIAAVARSDDAGGDEPHKYARSHSTETDRDTLLRRLASGREALGALALLTDQQLDAVPPAGHARFCDGQRTLDDVLARMLKHQGHQIDALRAAIT